MSGGLNSTETAMQPVHSGLWVIGVGGAAALACIAAVAWGSR